MKSYNSALLAILATSLQAQAVASEGNLRRLDESMSMSVGGKSGKGSKASKGSKGGSMSMSMGGPDSTCLTADMSASNGYEGDVSGTVEVCFNNPIGDITGSLRMSVSGLPELIAGGVHIHSGRDCATTLTQGGHGWKTETLNTGGPKNDGDAWFNIASSLAPTGTGYSTDEDGKGSAYFFFNNGFGYDETKGQAVIIHGEVGTQVGVELGDGDYARIACGILE